MPEADLTSSWIDELLRGHHASGIAAAVSVWTPASRITRWTTPDDSAQEPAFLIYSITKTFIACLLLQLVDEGRLDLDVPVNRLWQGWPLPDGVTPRRLLNHTAGVPDYGGLDTYHAQVREHPGEPWTQDQFVQATLAQPFAVPDPGRFAYSNPGYMVLLQLLQAVGGAPLQGQLFERLCRPLDLCDTRVATTEADLLPLAPGLSRVIGGGDTPVDVRGRYHPGWVSHGVIAAPASDVSTFMQALFSRRLLSDQSLDAMFDAMPVGGAAGRWEQPHYGLGLMCDPASVSGFVRGHNGGGPGYSASSFGVWRDGSLCGIATAMVGGGQHDAAEMLTFEVLARCCP